MKICTGAPSSGYLQYLGAVLVPAVMTLAACDYQTATHPAQPAPVEVGFVIAQAGEVALTNSYTGRAIAYQSAEVRPQVAGVILRRLFIEGQMVTAEQPLYQIDPSLYAASVKQAKANLLSARARTQAADELVGRYRPLSEMEAVSKQDFVNAVAGARQAHAAVAQARAALETAETMVRFSTVPAPLSGRIGRSLVTVGGLATVGQAAPLATIQQLDPIFVDIQQSASQITTLRRAIASKTEQASQSKVRITLPDGSPYQHTGTIEFSEVMVDPATGTATLRIRVPNPDGLLLPGTFIRASFAQSSLSSAFRVPQQSLLRDTTGQAYVWLVSSKKTAVKRTVTAMRTDGGNWIVTKGLHDGDKIVVQGIAKLRPDIHVAPVSAKSAQHVVSADNRDSVPKAVS